MRTNLTRLSNAGAVGAALAGSVLAPVWLLAPGPDPSLRANAASASSVTVLRATAPARKASRPERVALPHVAPVSAVLGVSSNAAPEHPAPASVLRETRTISRPAPVAKPKPPAPAPAPAPAPKPAPAPQPKPAPSPQPTPSAPSPTGGLTAVAAATTPAATSGDDGQPAEKRTTEEVRHRKEKFRREPPRFPQTDDDVASAHDEGGRDGKRSASDNGGKAKNGETAGTDDGSRASDTETAQDSSSDSQDEQDSSKDDSRDRAERNQG
jgi:hypothetical protein